MQSLAKEYDDTALVELLEETATFERVSYTMVDGQLYVQAKTNNAVHR